MEEKEMLEKFGSIIKEIDDVCTQLTSKNMKDSITKLLEISLKIDQEIWKRNSEAEALTILNNRLSRKMSALNELSK